MKELSEEELQLLEELKEKKKNKAQKKRATTLHELWRIEKYV